MARRKAPLPELGPSGVPVALTDPAARDWHDEAAFAKLLATLGVHVRIYPSVMRAACAERRNETVRAWAAANGFMNPRWPNTLDHTRLRSIGITNLRSYPSCPHRAA